MSAKLPKYPNWVDLGAEPEPLHHDSGLVTSDGMPVWMPDRQYEIDHEAWLERLSPEHRAIYDDWWEEALKVMTEWDEEDEAMDRRDYEKHGLEKGVNTSHELEVARNMATLMGMLNNVESELQKRDANEQFEAMFRRRSES